MWVQGYVRLDLLAVKKHTLKLVLRLAVTPVATWFALYKTGNGALVCMYHISAKWMIRFNLTL